MHSFSITTTIEPLSYEAIIEISLAETILFQAAALTQPARAVYDQIQAVLKDSSITDKEAKIEEIMNASTTTQAIKDELKAAFPFFGEHGGKQGHGGHGGHGDHGDHGHGRPTTTPPASP